MSPPDDTERDDTHTGRRGDGAADGAGHKAKAATRQARLEASLKANIQRRKAQAQARTRKPETGTVTSPKG